jgi:hypothetical protein
VIAVVTVGGGAIVSVVSVVLLLVSAVDGVVSIVSGTDVVGLSASVLGKVVVEFVASLALLNYRRLPKQCNRPNRPTRLKTIL